MLSNLSWSQFQALLSLIPPTPRLPARPSGHPAPVSQKVLPIRPIECWQALREGRFGGIWQEPPLWYKREEKVTTEARWEGQSILITAYMGSAPSHSPFGPGVERTQLGRV